MRRLLYALPFLLFGLGILFMELTVEKAVVVGLNWLTFLIERRYGGGGKEEDELTAIGISTSLVLLLVSPVISKIIALFAFMLVLGGRYLRTTKTNP